MNKLLVIALLWLTPILNSDSIDYKWGKHSYIWDFTELEIRSELGLSDYINLKDFFIGVDPSASLYSIDGHEINHAYLEGKVVLLDFWYIKCGPCRRELPALTELSRMFDGREVVILSFSRDAADEIIEYDLDHTFLNVHVIADVYPHLSNDLEFRFPFKALVDPTGRLVYSFLGGKKTDTPVADFIKDFGSKIEVLLKGEG